MYFRFRFKYFRYRLFIVFSSIFISVFVFVNEYNVFSLTTIFVFVNEINTEPHPVGSKRLCTSVAWPECCDLMVELTASRMRNCKY
jgi:hypothetical protein